MSAAYTILSVESVKRHLSTIYLSFNIVYHICAVFFTCTSRVGPIKVPWYKLLPEH